MDKDCAEAIAEIFSEVIVAPEFETAALEILQKRKNLVCFALKGCEHLAWKRAALEPTAF
jgi:phosphoribosylaminoimidazolecarboxamide formyltransferase/IMP cyclohydrolase